MRSKKYDTLTSGCGDQTRVQSVSNYRFHFDVLWRQHSIVLGEPVIVLKETDVCMKKYDTLTAPCDEQTRVQSS